MHSLRSLPWLLSMAAFAQERPAWQALRTARIEGAETVSAARIRSAMAQDSWTRRVMAQNDSGSAAGVAARLTDALHGCGLMQASVEVALADQNWQIRVHEGPLHRCGPIAIRGATPISQDTLTAGLREKFDAWPGWQAGQPAPADPWLLPTVKSKVEQIFREHGYHGAVAEAAFDAADGQVTLAITVTHGGRLLRAKRIDIDGDTEADEVAALALLAWTPDRVLTSAAIDEVRNRLLRTGRYAAVTVQLPGEAPPSLDPLVVTVQPIAGAPGLAEPAARDLARLAAGLDSLQARFLAGCHAHVTMELTEKLPLGRLTVLPGKVHLDVGIDGILLEAARLQAADAPPAPAMFAIDRHALWLQCFARSAQIAFDSDPGLQLSLSTTVDAAGKAEFRWGFGISTGSRSRPRITLDPGTAAAMLQRPAIRREWHGDVLHLTFGDTTVRLGSDGVLVDDVIVIPTAGPPLSLTFADRPIHAAIAAARDADNSVPQMPFTTMLLDLAATAATDAVPGTSPTNQALLAGIATTLQTAATEPPFERQPPLRIRTRTEERPIGDPTAFVFATLFGALAASTELDGWPTQLIGCAATFADGDRRGALRSLLQFADLPTTGPIALLAFAVAGSLLDDELATQLRAAARDRWSFDAVLADLQPFLQPDSDFGRHARTTGAEWRKTASLREIVGGADNDLAAFRMGLDHLWQQGLGDRLRDLLLAEPR